MLVGAAAGAAAAPGTAQNFLDRAERLKAKGPLAFFDSDYGRLKDEATAAGKSLEQERIAAERSGKPIFYCSPNPRAELGSLEFVSGLETIPPSERAHLDLKQAMLRILQRKYPCRGQAPTSSARSY